jgi:hypothetical protein
MIVLVVTFGAVSIDFTVAEAAVMISVI